MAVIYIIDIRNLGITSISNYCNHKCDFNNTNWDKFQSKLQKNIYEIPDNRNLTIDEIDNNIEIITNKIVTSLYKLSPKIKNSNSVDLFNNRKIKNLRTMNEKVLTALHRLKDSFPVDTLLISHLKRRQKIIRNLIKK